MNSPDNDSSSNRLIDLLTLATEYLQTRGVEDPRLNAEYLLSSVLTLNRVELYLNFDRPLSEPEKNRYRELLRRRGRREPLQYLLGETDFRDLTLLVRPGVLIPRPETEQLVERIKTDAPGNGYQCALDAGCGSGAIGLALLQEHLVKRVIMVDIAPAAIELTRTNAVKNGLDPDRIGLLTGDMFELNLPRDGSKFDLVVSNPPYIRSDQWDTLAPEIRNHEPPEALLAGEDGLSIHRSLAEYLPSWLNEHGSFYGEIGTGQGEQSRLIHQAWARRVEVYPDLAGHDRIIRGLL